MSAFTRQSLLALTVTLLKSRSQTLEEISRATGLSVFWLAKLQSGAFDDPSVNRIQRLYEHLSGTALVR